MSTEQDLEAEIQGLRAEVSLLRDGYNVRPMTEVESNLMTQVLTLRRAIGSVRALCESAPTIQDPWAYDWKGDRVVRVDDILSALAPATPEESM